MPALTPFPAIVIGGGISGLVCAYRLQQAGIPVRVLEASDRPGGVIATEEQDGFRFELGPQSFLSTEPLLELIEALGLKNELLHADPGAPRYILFRGKLVPAPLAPPSLLTTPLLGARTKWHLVTEMFRRTTPPPNDESIAAFVRRKFGDELLDRLVAPFVSGVYAGDPEKLSLRASFPKLHEFETKYGSVLRGAMKSRPAKGTPRPGLCSFREGMETLPRALGARLGDALLTETTVTGARRDTSNGNSWFEVDVTRNGHRETLLASALIMAAPVQAASEILKDVSDKFATPFARIEYAPVAVVAAGYRLDQLRNAGNGFGFLVPRSERLRVLGTVWNSSLFPGRAPENMACFASFAGGATDPELFSKSDDEIAEIICGEVGRILRITGPPVTYLVKRYPRGLPQYNLGHSETISALAVAASSIPGLFLTGNYLSGPSISSCIEQANQTAEAVRVYLASIGVAGVGAVAHA
ncbi:MAG: Protoporphyrinogen oxidase [Candidatus Acidoferrum typicum]|nr:Protoporphyrinogen oxidase [Candidatus Acidoferrum typicum]